jgi:hypothetical protein
MALIAPRRRDTRPPELRSRDGFGRRPGPALGRSVSVRRGGALARASAAEGLNRLGLTREMVVGAIGALGVFLWMHGANLGRPSALAEAFNPAPMRTFFAMGGEGLRCQAQAFGWLAGLAEEPTGCDQISIDAMLAANDGEGNVLGMVAAQRAGVRQEISDRRERAGGTFSSAASPETKLAEVKSKRCFQTDRYSVGDRGLHSVDERPAEGETISLRRYLALGDDAAQRVTAASVTERDAALLDYFKARKNLGQVIHRFFGDPGRRVAGASYAGPVHASAVAVLRQRLNDPAFAPELSDLERAEIEILAADPLDFVSCTARRG